MSHAEDLRELVSTLIREELGRILSTLGPQKVKKKKRRRKKLKLVKEAKASKKESA